MGEDRKPAANVIEALCRVMDDLPGIGKDGKAAPQQGGYAYRGIDQITPHTQQLFARHGVVFVPRVASHELREIVVAGKPWLDVVVLVEYTAYGPGGIEDRITVGPVLAIGRDNSDKGGNKALTQAMKYALLQTLQVSDPVDDADGETYEADHHPPHSAPKPVSQRQAPTVKQLAIKANEVFAAEGEEAPEGRKTKVLERLRHATIHVATGGETVSLAKLDEPQRVAVDGLLTRIADGNVTVTHDQDDRAGAQFVLHRPGHTDGDKETIVLWAEVDPREAAA